MSHPQRILIYLLRRDLRIADNPILHEISKLHSQSHAPFTHLLPLYVFPAQQVEVSGFLSSEPQGPPAPQTLEDHAKAEDGSRDSAGSSKTIAGFEALAISQPRSPYPEARSQVGGFWRCGHHRAKFLAESVWDVKKGFENLGSGLEIRVGMVGDVVRTVLDGYKDGEITGLWMTEEEGVEEKREEKSVRREVEKRGAKFRLWKDEKYFVDDRDLPFQNPNGLSDVFTTFRNQVEPLRDAPRRVIPKPTTLPPLPPIIPPQFAPFQIPTNLPDIISALHKPLTASLDLKHPPQMPSNGATTAIPFLGGETAGHKRIRHLVPSGCMSTYKDTRNGMLGADFSTKLSAFLALGCVTARQVHQHLLDFEDGTTELGRGAQRYGKGENRGTASVRFELLWRDYMRLCTRKFGPRLFQAYGFRGDAGVTWNYDKEKLNRWLEGRTGMGLVDASQRELWCTGYTSNRARQNVASFLSKHLGLDWRLGAEWYECCLVDYDLSSNWGNWQYNSGIGNDPREGGVGRKFNPVKQAGDYDSKAEYIRAWVPEVRGTDTVEEAWQCWKVPVDRRKALGLEGNVGAEHPLVKIEYRMGRGGGQRRGGGGGGGGPGPGSARGGRGARGGRDRGNGRDGFSKRDML